MRCSTPRCWQIERLQGEQTWRTQLYYSCILLKSDTCIANCSTCGTGTLWDITDPGSRTAGPKILFFPAVHASPDLDSRARSTARESISTPSSRAYGACERSRG